MPDNELKREEEERLREICRRLLPPRVPEPLVSQVVRILVTKLGAAEALGIKDRAGLVRVFGSLRLLSPRLLVLLGKKGQPERPAPFVPLEMPSISASLLERLERVMVELTPAVPANRPSWDADSLAEGLAVCFAASTYPQRVSQMVNTSLALRVEAWLDEFLRLRQPNSPFPAVDRLPEMVSQAELLVVLGGASSQYRDSDLRLNGAALYLASCCREEIDRIVGVWHTEAPIVTFLRKWLSTPPSWTVGEDRSERRSPDWGRVRSALARLCRGEESGLVDQAVILEQMAWKISRQYLEPDMLAQSVQETWEQLWARLTSGFPYYAFRSRFTWWWKQCLHHWFQGRSDPIIEPHKIDEATIVRRPQNLTPETLRCVREGYRLVRSTFYPQRGEPHTGPGKNTARPQDVVVDNERARAVVDEIWSYRIRCRITDGEGEKKMCKHIAETFGLKEETVHTYCRRLRLKLWAYQLARLERFSHAEILSSDPPVEYGQAKARNINWEGVPGVPLIAAIARAVLPDHTLLWAFAAHVLLHDLLDPQHPDPWTSRRFRGELWHWVNDEAFENALAQGGRDHSVVDREVQEALKRSPLGNLLGDLRACRDASQAECCGDERESAGRPPDWVEAAREILASIAGPEVLATCDKAAFQKWRAVIGDTNRHWIVPVWYLTVLEQIDDKQIGLRCQPPQQADRLEALGRAIRARLAPPSTSAPPECPVATLTKRRRSP